MRCSTCSRGAPGPDPADRVEDGELRDALMTLSPLDREAVVLTAWFDLSSADAARALGVTPAAFRMRAARARRRLRAALTRPRDQGAPPMGNDRPMTSSPSARHPPAAADVDEDAFDASCWPACASSRSPRAAPSRAPSPCRCGRGRDPYRDRAVMSPAAPATSAAPRRPRPSAGPALADPPPGTILHVRSVETQGAQTTTREAGSRRTSPPPSARAPRAHTLRDLGRRALRPGDRQHRTTRQAAGRGRRKKGQGGGPKVATAGTPRTGKPGDEAMPAGDPVVDKVRILLEEGRMTVSGREIHNGTDTWAISLKPDVGRPVWTLWVSAADGKPSSCGSRRDASESRR